MYIFDTDTIVNQATFLNRNLSDFGQILELKSEDWTENYR